jgi:hypothetical protein
MATTNPTPTHFWMKLDVSNIIFFRTPRFWQPSNLDGNFSRASCSLWKLFSGLFGSILSDFWSIFSAIFLFLEWISHFWQLSKMAQLSLCVSCSSWESFSGLFGQYSSIFGSIFSPIFLLLPSLLINLVNFERKTKINNFYCLMALLWQIFNFLELSTKIWIDFFSAIFSLFRPQTVTTRMTRIKFRHAVRVVGCGLTQSVRWLVFQLLTAWELWISSQKYASETASCWLAVWDVSCEGQRRSLLPVCFGRAQCFPVGRGSICNFLYFQCASCYSCIVLPF